MFMVIVLLLHYDWTVSGGLDINTQHILYSVDSGSYYWNDGFPWEGIQDERAWRFTTGPKVSN